MADSSSSSSLEESSSSSFPFVVHTSSSSSFGLSSSSSSIDSDSSVSSDSSSLSSRSLSSGSSLSTSSSSSLDSSSSSSSSLYKNNGNKMVPFVWQGIKSEKVRCFSFWDKFCYVGMDGNGEVLRSQDRYHWEVFFKTGDFSAPAIYAFDDNLFVGTSPEGKVYKISLIDGTYEELDSASSDVTGFFEINSQLHMCAGKMVYKYSESSGRFVEVYETYAGITDVFSNNTFALLALNGTNIIKYDGSNWTLATSQKETIASVRNLSTEPFSKIEFAHISRTKSVGFSKDDYVEMAPYNREIGISCIDMINEEIVAGGLTYGRVFSVSDQQTKILFDTDVGGVHAICKIDNQSIFASMGNILYMGWFGDLNQRQQPVPRWNFVKIMELDGEFVSCIAHDEYLSQFLIGTSKGRILSTNKVRLNAFATGTRQIYVKASNEYGAQSDIGFNSIVYALHNRIVEISEEKSINKWKYTRRAAIEDNEKAVGVFISPIISVNNDFGMWKTLIWNETRSEGSKVRVFLKAAKSINELYLKDWQVGFQAKDGESGNISRPLNDIRLDGNIVQIKVEMEVVSDADGVASVSLEYSAKNAAYFFTTLFSVEGGSTRGLITANISKPVNTEVIFGVSGGDSADWNDYQVVEPDRFFSTDKITNMKVGIKFVSYDESLPEVSEFSIIRNKVQQ